MNKDVIFRISNALDLILEAQSDMLGVILKHPLLPPPDRDALNRAARRIMEAQTTVDALESFV